MKKFWTVCDGAMGLGLVSVARELAECVGAAAEAVCFGDTTAASVFAAGAQHIYAVTGVADERGKALALKALVEREAPEILLFPSTVEYRTVAPMLAAMVHTGLTADCTGLSLTDAGLLRQTRPALGGSISVDILCENSLPQMATAQENAFPPFRQDYPAGGTVSREDFSLDPVVRILSVLPRGEKSASLQSARVIVSGGKGIGSKDGFMKLRELASLIPGAMLGASRGAVSASYAPYECQVGLTGEFVSPKLYLAFGISGAVQHLAGMKQSKTIISVNTDPRAPIFDYSDVAVTAPWETVADRLIVALR